jgi:integrase
MSPAVAVQKRTRVRAPAKSSEPEWDIDVRPQATVAEFVQHWLKGRSPATRQADAQRLRDHVLPLLGSRRLRELQAEDVASVVRHMLAKKGMTVKSARNAHGVFHELLGHALARELIAEDPRALPSDIWPAEDPAAVPRYSLAEVAALTTDERLEPEQRVYNTLAFYSRLPSADICQLRFGDWQQRVPAPVAPELARALEQWQQAGFQRAFGRAPGAADWLVPRRSDPTQPHGEGSAFKAFRRACVALKIKTRSPRAIQNTFGEP